MSFALEWLDLREPADHAARDPSLLDAAAAFLMAAEAPLVVDLGAGSGSTLRAFGARVAGARWRLVDRDRALLGAAAARAGAETVEADLRAVDSLPLAGARLVTASALLDLVSAAWVERLAGLLAADVGLYAALSYDGTVIWEPALREDAAVLAAFNAHQRGDKGFGPALGPDAGRHLARVLEERGFAVATAASPWQLGPEQWQLQAALAEGIGAAAAESGVVAGGWVQARREAAMAGVSSCIVGHLDVLALPDGARRQSKTTSVSSP